MLWSTLWGHLGSLGENFDLGEFIGARRLDRPALIEALYFGFLRELVAPSQRFAIGWGMR